MLERPPVSLVLTWEGDLRFRGDVTGRGILLDGDSKAGVSPVEALAFALASCMGSDLVHILRKQRADLKACTIHFVGRRAEADPRRFVAIEVRFALQGDLAPDRVERAIALSRNEYCSVWHSLAPDIAFTTSFAIAEP